MSTHASTATVREVLERVSRVLEKTPGLTAREVRARTRLRRQTCEEALELLRRGNFILRQAGQHEDTYSSALPYRANDYKPRAPFGSTHGVRQGGVG